MKVNVFSFTFHCDIKPGSAFNFATLTIWAIDRDEALEVFKEINQNGLLIIRQIVPPNLHQIPVQEERS